MTAAVRPPLTEALDPSHPYSLVCLSLSDLPAEVIGTQALRRLKLVKTLGGERGLTTEVQQFQDQSGTGIRSIAATIQEFNLPKGEVAVLRALERATAFDIASRRLALLSVLSDDPVRSRLLEDCAALRLDRASQQATEALTMKYTLALFAGVFTDGQEGVRSIGQLVARLNRASANADLAERKRAQAHVVHLQQRFQLKDVGDLLRFFGDFELLVTAIGYYRRSFAGLVPHMRQLDVNVRALSPPDDQMTATMLATVSAHLNHAVTKIEQFFDSFDASFDDILSSAEPQTFKRLQENLQRAYGRVGALLCGWGLRLQAVEAFMRRQRMPPKAQAQIDMIREVVCRHLDQSDLNFTEIDDAIRFLREASGR